MKRDVGPRCRRFVNELHAFCKAKKGRSVQLASYLGIPPTRIYGWWKYAHYPTLEQALGIIEWRKKEINQ